MKKSRIVSTVAAAVCATAVAVTCAACSPSLVDCTGFTYDQFAAVTYEQWDAKPMAYQFHTNTKEGERMDVGFGAQGCYTQVILNLYEDGSAAYFQAGIYTTGAKEQVWYDKDNFINWAHFGFWEEKDGTLTVALLGWLSANGEGGEGGNPSLTVSMDPSFAENPFTTYVTMTAVNGVYTYSKNDVAASTGSFMRYGVNSNGEGMGIDQEMVGKTGDSIEYPTIQSWINTYIDDEKGIN